VKSGWRKVLHGGALLRRDTSPSSTTRGGGQRRRKPTRIGRGTGVTRKRGCASPIGGRKAMSDKAGEGGGKAAGSQDRGEPGGVRSAMTFDATKKEEEKKEATIANKT